jgi:putative hydrolase of the HAD superfamily
MPFTTFFIDLDDTVYPSSSGLWMAIRQRIELFVALKLNLPVSEASTVRRGLFYQYGTTLRGLQAMYQVDVEEYLNFVHDVPLDDYIGPDPALKTTLMAYPQQKVIFTNADRSHARRVLAKLGIESCFDKIIDLHDFQPYCKPMPEAFQAAFDLLEVKPEQCVLIDDTLNNLVTAKSFGMWTIWVTQKPPAPAADSQIPNLRDLPRVLAPGLNGKTPGG